MEFNNKKLERTSRLINYVIAIALCWFLILLSGKVMDDVDEWEERPDVEAFQNKELLDSLNAAMQSIEEEVEQRHEKVASLENTARLAKSNYDNARESFDNWLKARRTIGSPKEDKAVIARAEKLDEYYLIEQEWRQELAVMMQGIQELEERKAALRLQEQQEQARAYDERTVAIRKYDLKVFLIRLLVILPILLLGIFFIVRLRKHKYWPLFLGFVLFAFYAFFFGLVPYLPSYGGYIRYAVGIILSIALGIYAINIIRAFIERKRNELKVSSTERAKAVKAETAEKALDNHMCPSCGKDFIVKRWDNTTGEKKKNEGSFGYVTNFCRFCGLELFKKCNACSTENYAHLPFCSGCGAEVTKK